MIANKQNDRYVFYEQLILHFHLIYLEKFFPARTDRHGEGEVRKSKEKNVFTNVIPSSLKDLATTARKPIKTHLNTRNNKRRRTNPKQAESRAQGLVISPPPPNPTNPNEEENSSNLGLIE